MLAGKPVYEGETVPETLAHVITKESAWDSLPVSTPTAIRHLLVRCLTKDTRTRLQAMGEADDAVVPMDGARQVVAPALVAAD